MRPILVFLLLIALPVVSAQEGLFVSRHNITYTLGESDYSVEEVIVFENAGSPSGNLFKDNIYFTKGDARDVEVSAVEKDLEYSVGYSPATIININLLLWKGERREVVIRYRRSDMLFREGMIYTFSGPALGMYSWITDRAIVKFIAPDGFQFGSVTPDIKKTLEGEREVLTHDITPVSIENLTAIRDGIPVNFEYAKYGEMTFSEIKNAEEFIEDAESDLSSANKSIENAKNNVSDMTEILTLFALASATLDESKNAFDLAKIKSNLYYAEYSPYEAYIHAAESKILARDASKNAKEAKDLANNEIQRALEEKISGIGSKLSEQSNKGGVLAPDSDKQIEAAGGPLPGFGIAAVLILAAIVIFDIYRRSGGYRRSPTSKKSTVRDFRAIDELKHKTFKGFDKKLDTVKYGTELATEIRNLRKKKEDLEFARKRLQRRKELEEIPDHQFEEEKENLDSRINEASARIGELKARLNELKKVNR